MNTLRLKNCELRKLQLSDASNLAEHANNPSIARNLRDQFPNPYTVEDAQAFIESAQCEHPDLHLAIDLAGEIIGVIGIRYRDNVHRLTAEVGYPIGESYWGRGIATEALRGITDHVFENTDLIRLDAIAYSWNPASAKVLEKAGYTREAVMKSYVYKNEEVLDGWLYARIKGES